MATERLDRLGALADSWNRGDLDGLFDALSPNVEFTPDPSFPDGRAMGGGELREWLNQWADTWPQSELELLELSDRGAAATARARWHLQASDSEIEIPVGDFTFAIWFDEMDRPVRILAFFDHEQALRTIERG